MEIVNECALVYVAYMYLSITHYVLHVLATCVLNMSMALFLHTARYLCIRAFVDECGLAI